MSVLNNNNNNNNNNKIPITIKSWASRPVPLWPKSKRPIAKKPAIRIPINPTCHPKKRRPIFTRSSKPWKFSRIHSRGNITIGPDGNRIQIITIRIINNNNDRVSINNSNNGHGLGLSILMDNNNEPTDHPPPTINSNNNNTIVALHLKNSKTNPW